MPKEKAFSISEIYTNGKEKLKNDGVKWAPPPDSILHNHLRANRNYLDSLFFEPRFLDPVEPDTSCQLFGVKLKAPILCSPMGKAPFMTDTALTEISQGVKDAGVMMMLGIGGSTDLKKRPLIPVLQW